MYFYNFKGLHSNILEGKIKEKEINKALISSNKMHGG